MVVLGAGTANAVPIGGGGDDPPPDDCVAATTADFTVTPGTVTLGQSVTVRWNVEQIPGCTVWKRIDGFGFGGESVPNTGSRTILPTPEGTAHWSLSVSGSLGNSYTLGAASVTVQPMAAGSTTSVCALTSDRQAVMRYNGSGTSWTQIGRRATRLYSGGYGLFALSDAGFERYLGSPLNWQLIGSGFNATWAVSGEGVYSLAADYSGVWRWTGSGTAWTQVGGPAAWLYGGGYGMFATTPNTRGISRYLGAPFTWQYLYSPISPPAITYAVGRTAIYGLPQSSPFVEAVQTASANTAYEWQTYGRYGEALWLVGGGAGTFAIAGGGSLIQSNGFPIARPGSPFAMIYSPNPDWAIAITDDSVYAASPDGASVWKWTGQGTTWVQVGTFPVAQIVPCQ